MEPDIHIRHSEKERLGYLLNGFTYPTLCGINVVYERIDVHHPKDYPAIYGRATSAIVPRTMTVEPTCMACILVNLQNKAEHGS